MSESSTFNELVTEMRFHHRVGDNLYETISLCKKHTLVGESWLQLTRKV